VTGDTNTADTSLPEPDPSVGTCTETYDGPVIVERATVTCDAQERVTYEVVTAGWTRSGRMNAMETANLSPWDDEHDLVSVAYDPCGSFDELQRTLTTGASVATAVEDQSTVFTCDGHFDDTNGVMTYAARVYDIDGNFADCLAWGHDPVDYAAGLYSGSCIHCPTDPEELTQCVVARRAR
jgi:hypothetical protein